MTRPMIAVDLDGTLATYTDWQGIAVIGAPRPGAREFVAKLREKFQVMIYTARCKARPLDTVEREELQSGDPNRDPVQVLTSLVRAWLDSHGIVVDGIYSGQGKPHFACVVDDRAVWIKKNPSEEDFDAAYEQVLMVVNQE